MFETMPDRDDEHYDFLMRNYCDRHKFTFDVWCKDPIVKDMEKINPMKQAEVARICHILDECDYIVNAWVIGSSCTPGCTKYSDLDMIIETTIPADEEPEYLIDAMVRLHIASENGMDLLRLECLAPEEPISWEIYWRAKVK